MRRPGQPGWPLTRVARYCSDVRLLSSFPIHTWRRSRGGHNSLDRKKIGTMCGGCSAERELVLRGRPHASRCSCLAIRPDENDVYDARTASHILHASSHSSPPHQREARVRGRVPAARLQPPRQKQRARAAQGHGSTGTPVWTPRPGLLVREQAVIASHGQLVGGARGVRVLGMVEEEGGGGQALAPRFQGEWGGVRGAERGPKASDGAEEHKKIPGCRSGLQRGLWVPAPWDVERDRPRGRCVSHTGCASAFGAARRRHAPANSARTCQTRPQCRARRHRRMRRPE
jgi:hypothetical protein